MSGTKVRYAVKSEYISLILLDTSILELEWNVPDTG